MEKKQYGIIQIKEVIMLPGDYKRDYKFKSNKNKDRLSYIIAIILSVIAFLVIWYLF